MKYLPPMSKMSLECPPSSSSLQAWLGAELERRGIDAVVYTRYILSILQQETFEADPEREVFPRKSSCPPARCPPARSPSLSTSRAASGKAGQRAGPRGRRRAENRSSEEWKKSAAVECLLSVSDEDSGIEGLVDELCVKLKEQSGCAKGVTLTAAEAESSDSVISTSPDDAVERYFAAFPALTAKVSGDSPSPRPVVTRPDKTWSTVAQTSAPDPEEITPQPSWSSRLWRQTDELWYYYSRAADTTARGKSQERYTAEKAARFSRQSSCPDLHVYAHQGFLFPQYADVQRVSPGKISLTEIFGTEEVSVIEPCKTLVVDGQLVRLCATSMNSNHLHRLTNVCLREAPMEGSVADRLWQETVAAGNTSVGDDQGDDQGKTADDEGIYDTGKEEDDHSKMDDEQGKGDIWEQSAENNMHIFSATVEIEAVEKSDALNMTAEDDVFLDDSQAEDLEDPVWYTGPIDIIAPEVSPVGTRSRLYKRTKMAAGGGYLPDNQPESGTATPTFSLLWEEVRDDSGVYIGAKLKEPTIGNDNEAFGHEEMLLDVARNVDILTGSSGSESESDYIDMSGAVQNTNSQEPECFSVQRFKSPDRLQIFRDLAKEESLLSDQCKCDSGSVSPSRVGRRQDFGTHQDPMISQYKGCVIPEITQNKVPDDRPKFFLDEPELNNNHFHHHLHSPSAKSSEDRCIVNSSLHVDNLLHHSCVPSSFSHWSSSLSYPSLPSVSDLPSSSTSSSPLTSLWTSPSLCNLLTMNESYSRTRSAGSRALFARGAETTSPWPGQFSSYLQMPTLSLSPLAYSDYMLISHSIWRDPPVAPPPKIWDINVSSRKMESPLESKASSDMGNLVVQLEYEDMKAKEDTFLEGGASFIEGGLYGGSDAWSMSRSDCSEDEGIDDDVSFPLSPTLYKMASVDMLDEWLNCDCLQTDGMWSNSMTGSMELLPSETSAFTREGLPTRLPQLPHVHSEPCMSPRQPFSRWARHKYRMVQVKHLYKPDTSILRHLGLTAEELEEEPSPDKPSSDCQGTPEHHFKPINEPTQDPPQKTVPKGHDLPGSITKGYELLAGVVCAPREDDTDTLTGSLSDGGERREDTAQDSPLVVTRTASGTLYQLYRGLETTAKAFAPRFRICREHKYIQTGDCAEMDLTATHELTEQLLIDILTSGDDADGHMGLLLDDAESHMGLLMDDAESHVGLLMDDAESHMGLLVETAVGPEQEEWETCPSSGKQSVTPSYDLAKFWEHSTEVTTTEGEDPASIWCYNQSSNEPSDALPADSSWEVLAADTQPSEETNQPLTSSPDLEHTLTQAYLADLLHAPTKDKQLKDIFADYPKISASLDPEPFEDRVSPIESCPIPIPRGTLDEMSKRRLARRARKRSLNRDGGQDLTTDEEDSTCDDDDKMMFVMDTSDQAPQTNDLGQASVSMEYSSAPFPQSLGETDKQPYTSKTIYSKPDREPYPSKAIYSKPDKQPYPSKVIYSKPGKAIYSKPDAAPFPTEISKAIYSNDLEGKWLQSINCFSVQVPHKESPQINSGSGSVRLCSFYLEGSCPRTDCLYSHDLSLTTCRYWEDGGCFKGVACPFLHGYQGPEN